MICYCVLIYIKSTFNHYLTLISNSIIGTYIQVNLPQWKCVLRSYKCYPKYKIPTVESDETINSPILKFQMYEVFTIYYKHGTI